MSKNTNETVNKAFQKEEEKKKSTITVIVIGLAIVLFVIAGAIVYDAVSKKTKSYEINYSSGYAADGMVEGISSALDYVTLCDLNGISRNYNDYYPTDEEVEDYITTITTNNAILDKTAGLTLKEDDEVNLDYTVFIDGEEYTATKGEGTDVSLLFSGYPEDFINAVKEHKVGDKFETTIDIPNESGETMEAVFEIIINGVYIPAEFNDEFVKTQFPNVASTADEFIAVYRDTYAKSAYTAELKEYILGNSILSKYPSSFLKKMENQNKARDQKAYEAAVEGYRNLGQEVPYTSVLEMKQMSQAEYNKYIKEQSQSNVKEALIIQALCEQYGIQTTDVDLLSMLSGFGYTMNDYQTAIDRFGEGYVNAKSMEEAVYRSLVENIIPLQ